MGQSCGCGDDHTEKPEENHGCNCGHDHDPTISPEEKVEELKKDIANLGFKVDEAEDGEIKISQ